MSSVSFMPRPRALAGLAVIGLGLGLSLTPLGADAGNGTHPRTPVLWDDPGDPNDAPACMTIVNRSVDPVVHLDYWIPYEDLDKTVDEVDDSRRQQVIGFCRHHSPQDLLPVWITDADVAAAEAKGLLPELPAADDVMETSDDWKACFVRLIADDARREITFAEAAKGVDWDTTEVAAGPYYIEGYTWEPVGNEWYRRRGVIKVVDSDDLTAAPPAMALDIDEDIIVDKTPFSIHGCVSAVDGSTITASWSFPDTVSWTPFATDVPVTGEGFAIDFEAPAELVGGSAMIKVELTDPMDRTVVAYANQIFTVIPELGTSTSTSGGCESIFIPDPECETTGGTTGGSDTTSTTEASTSAATTVAATTASSASATSNSQDDGGETGCSCRSGQGGAPGPLGLGLLILVALAGRRR